MAIINLFALIGDPWSAGASALNGIFGLISSHKDRASDWRIAQLNYQSQQETNEINRQIAAEANEAMMQMQRENNAFNAEQAEIARKWDSAAARFQRARDAGINPYVAASSALGSGQGQMASAAGAGAQLAAPQLQAPRYDMVQSRFSRMAEITGQMAQGIASLAQARKAGADAKRVQKLLNSELDIYESNAAKAKADATIAQTSADIMTATKDFEVAKREYESKQSYETFKNLRQQRKNLQQQCNLLVQQIATEKTVQDLNTQKSGTEVLQREYLVAQAEHLNNLDEFNKKQLGILAYNAETQRFSASIQEYVAKNPSTAEAFVIRMLTGAFGQDAQQIGKSVMDWIKKYVPKVWSDFKDKPWFKVSPDLQ